MSLVRTGIRVFRGRPTTVVLPPLHHGYSRIIVRGVKHVASGQSSTENKDAILGMESSPEASSRSHNTDIDDDMMAYTPPSLHDLPNRWTEVKSSDKLLADEIEEYLAWKMEGDWHELTREEAIAAYFISYGPWGARATTTITPATGPSSAYFGIRLAFNLTLLIACSVTLYNLMIDKRHHVTGITDSIGTEPSDLEGVTP